jgi:hypothetical protein
MRSRMKQYDVTNVIPKREDESAEEYGKRISDLSDFEYVARKFQGFFAEAEIGVHKLPWSEQLILANAISEERDRDRLLGFAKKYGVEGLRTFLAMDYDPELGQDILTMSEEFEQDVNRDIFGAYNRLVDQANELSRVVRKSDLFAEVELDEQVLEDFIPQFTESILRRAKDMLITGTTIAKKGQAETLDYAQQRITASDPREVAESLEIYAEASEKVNCLLGTDGQATRFRFEMIGSESESIPVSYSFQVLEDSGALSYMTIQLRKTGTKEPNLDREFDGEARINFLFSERPISLSVGDESRSNALSLRVDREGKVRESGQIRVNDPTMQQGEVSVEIGSLNYDDPKLPGALVGRIVSVGNGIANSSHGKEVQYYHNRESFSQALGRAETFAQIVRFIENQLERNFGQRLKQTA